MSSVARQTTILVTGASQGLGFETVKHLIQKPNNYIYVGARSIEKGKKAISLLQSVAHKTSTLEAIAIDVDSDESIDIVSKEITTLDILVNNAGICLDEKPIESSKQVRLNLKKTYETNVFGVASLTLALLHALKAAEKEGIRPAIVNVSSGLGSLTLMSNPEYPFYGAELLAYNSSKTALNGLTRYFSKILLPQGRVSYCSTNMTHNQGFLSAEVGGGVVADAILDNNSASLSFIQAGSEPGSLEVIAW